MPDYKAQRDALLEFIRQAPVASGVCCCGDDMKNHALDSHSPVDMWDHSVIQWVMEIEQSDVATPTDTRAAFEAHFGLTTRQKWQHPDGSYKFPEIQSKWEGYLAGVTAAAKAASAAALTPAAWICIYNDGEVEYTPLLELAEAAPTAIPLYRAPPVEQDPNMWLNVPEDGGPITSYYVAPVAAAAPGAAPVAYEFHNPETGHAIVDYSEHTNMGRLTAEKGYNKMPLFRSPVAPAAIRDAALEEAANAMQPALRSMLSRGEAADTIRALKSQPAKEVQDALTVAESTIKTLRREKFDLESKLRRQEVAAAAPGADDNGCKSCAILRRYEKTARERGYAMGKAAGDNELAQAQELLAAERRAHAETNTALTAEITRLESLFR